MPNNIIKCKTFSRDHNSPSGILVDDDVNYFLTKNPNIEIVNISHSSTFTPQRDNAYNPQRERHFFTITIFYKEQKEKTLTIPDIRNKLSPIKNLIALIENNADIEYIDKEIIQAKISIEYLTK